MSNKFRLNASTLYLTYPKCPLEPTDALEKLKKLLLRSRLLIKHYLIAREKHKDNTYHLHMCIWLNSEANIRDAHFADLKSGDRTYHGNYQSIKKPRECVTYVMKDENFITDSEEFLKTITTVKRKLGDTLAERLMNGETVRELTQDSPGYVMMHLAHIRTFLAWWQQESLLLLPFPPINHILTQLESRILYWLGTNLFEKTRPLKTPNLFLWGPPSIGKTSLTMIISKSLRTFRPSYQIKWWDNFDDSIDLIVYDEFKGQVELNFLNQILDGQHMIIPRRGGDFTKKRNIPIILCSNKPPTNIYNVDQVYIDAFLSRLLVINVETFIKIFK